MIVKHGHKGKTFYHFLDVLGMLARDGLALLAQVFQVHVHEHGPGIEIVFIGKNGSLNLFCTWKGKAPQISILDMKKELGWL